jgi:hypothetical protein
MEERLFHPGRRLLYGNPALPCSETRGKDRLLPGQENECPSDSSLY